MKTRKHRRLSFRCATLLVLVCTLFSVNLGCGFAPHWGRFSKHTDIIDVGAIAEPAYRVYVSPYYQVQQPRRIVMLPAGRTAGNYGETRILIDELAAKVRSTGAAEIVTPVDNRIPMQIDAVLEGKFDEREIVELSRQYNADAIALVRVNEFRSHMPMRLSSTMAIIDCNESVVVFAIDGTWDMSQLAIQNEYRNYLGTHYQQSPQLGQIQDVQLQSPRNLFSFIASQIADAVRSASY